ncbi:Crp/Fnr family transcriptional regulator [Membranihabitans maritimus]|uniref:Crp/Fnr family transcriptional regulator n=1 Tax=Membranihabitans maritimus TaxID=2904244 RepID=UPI001F405879|nr:Crp/Fnr family transcriptional regulator [Membranihabitans maritimus]
MSELKHLSFALSEFAGLSAEDFEISEDCWQFQTYKKGDYFNKYKNVCKYLGFVLEGVFRSYIIDKKTGEEKNVFFYSGNQFVVTFKSFINQVPCDYHTKSMTDAKILCIHINHLMKLYKTSHAWERFGRILAQQAFNVVMERTESFLFKTPEERYLDLIKQHPNVFNNIPLYHISSYLGIQGPSLSRIRKRLSTK